MPCWKTVPSASVKKDADRISFPYPLPAWPHTDPKSDARAPAAGSAVPPIDRPCSEAATLPVTGHATPLLEEVTVITR